MTKPTILITGGAGYIGSQTGHLLVDLGYQIIVLDSLQKGFTEAVPSQAKFVQGSVEDKALLAKIFTENQVSGVIHFAADPAINQDISENISTYYRNNLFGTLCLLESMNQAGVKNIVFSSTAAVYGNPESLPIKESQSLLPLNVYGQTKLMAERMLEDFHRLNGFSAIRLRYFNACGADLQTRTGERHDPETHLIPIILQVAAGLREKIYVFGNDYNTPDGTCVRDYIHTVDLAKAHVAALEFMFKSGRPVTDAFNVATGNGYSNLEIIKMVQQITGKNIPFEYGPKRPGDWASAYADNSKIKATLNWQPQHSDLETIIGTAWKWTQHYFKNQIKQ